MASKKRLSTTSSNVLGNLGEWPELGLKKIERARIAINDGCCELTSDDCAVILVALGVTEKLLRCPIAVRVLESVAKDTP